ALAARFAERPPGWRARLQTAVHPNVTAAVEFNAGLLKSDAGSIRDTSNRRQNVAAVDVLLAGWGARGKGNLVSRSPTDLNQLSLNEDVNAFIAEQTLHLLRDVDILPCHDLRTGLDDGHFAAKAAISLGQFQAGISPTDHDQMLRQIIELESVNMRERVGRLQVGNIWNGRVGSDIEENLVSYQLARAAVVQIHLKGFWRYETAAAHDQFGAARAVNLQVLRNLALYHRALALTNNHHVDGDGTGHSTVLPAVARKGPTFRPRLFLLHGDQGHLGRGAAAPPPLHDGRPVPRLRHVPGYKFAANTTPKNEHFKLL